MRSPVNEIRMVLSKNPCMHIHLILFFFQSKDRNKLISQFVKYLTTKGQQTLKLRFLRLIIFINLFFCGNIKIECIQVLSGWSNIIYIRSICKDLLRNLANIENNNWWLLFNKRYLTEYEIHLWLADYFQRSRSESLQAREVVSIRKCFSKGGLKVT